MRLELIHVGLLVELANHYTTRGALGFVQGGYLDLAYVTSFSFPLYHIYELLHCNSLASKSVKAAKKKRKNTKIGEYF